MPDSSSPDSPQDDKPRGYRPVPGVIDLDAVDADARNALWGSEPADAAPDAEDAPPTEDDMPPAPVPPPPARATTPPPEVSAQETPSPETPVEVPQPLAPPDNTRVETPEPRPPRPAAPPPAETPLPVASSAEPDPDATGGIAPQTEPPASDTSATPILPEPLRPSEAIVQTAKDATKDRGRELVALVTEYGKRHIPDTPRRPQEPDTGPPRLVGRIGQVLPFMRAIPWVLAIGFGASFLWDFPGATVSVFGRVIPLEGLLRILSISGMIGFLTNWLAITMLFQPREKRAIIPQGLIPAQRERVIYRLSDAISRELINADIIKQKIQESGVVGRYRDLGLSVVRGVVEDPDFRTDLKDLAQRYAQETLGSEEVRRELAKIAVDKVEQQAGQGLGGAALKLYRTFAEDDFQRRVDNALRELPQAVTPLLDRIDAALDAVPEKVEARGDEIEEAATKAVLSFVEGFDIQAMIQEKARGFDEAQLENLLKSTSNEQLNYIKYLGGILGVFGGLVIWRAEMLIVFVIVGLVLWALDEVLVRARRTREADA